MEGNGSTKYIGSKINGIEITPSGLLMMAHLKGGGYVGQYLKNKGSNIETDGYGTSPESYLKKFAGYDVSEITDPTYYFPKFNGNKSELAKKMMTQGADLIKGVASQSSPVLSDDVIKNIPIQPPLSEAEWRKRLLRQRLGLE